MSGPTTVRCESVAATHECAARVAALARPGQLVVLVGPLGAGKTTFVQGYAAALGVTSPVTSPSFTLAHHYACGPGAPVALLVHADLWRLDGPGEVADLALDEVLDEGAAAIVEWGDRFDAARGRDRVVVTFRVVDDEARELVVDLDAANLGPDGRL